MILIVTAATDPTAQQVTRLLSARGHRFAMIDRGDYPGAMSLTYTIGPGPGGAAHRCRGAAGTLDLDEVRSIWWRRPGRVRAAAGVEHAEVRRYVEASAAQVFTSFLDDLPCLHVPARRATVQTASEKLPQLSLAHALGLEVPDTLVTSDVDELLAFYHRHHGAIITKPTAVGIDSVVAGGFTGYARPLRPRDLQFIHDVALCPITAQAYIEKAVELRVTIVGTDIFAAEIDSQTAHRTRVDWRHYDEHNTTYRTHALPDPVARRCLELVRRMGLAYGALDLVVTPDRRYVFLEINPNGQYQWIEDATGLPISARIATLLQELE